MSVISVNTSALLADFEREPARLPEVLSRFCAEGGADESQLFEFARLCAERNGAATADLIGHFNLQNPDERFAVATLCAAGAQRTVIPWFAKNFELDPDRTLDVMVRAITGKPLVELQGICDIERLREFTRADDGNALLGEEERRFLFFLELTYPEKVVDLCKLLRVPNHRYPSSNPVSPRERIFRKWLTSYVGSDSSEELSALSSTRCHLTVYLDGDPDSSSAAVIYGSVLDASCNRYSSLDDARFVQFLEVAQSLRCGVPELDKRVFLILFRSCLRDKGWDRFCAIAQLFDDLTPEEARGCRVKLAEEVKFWLPSEFDENISRIATRVTPRSLCFALADRLSKGTAAVSRSDQGRQDGYALQYELNFMRELLHHHFENPVIKDVFAAAIKYYEEWGSDNEEALRGAIERAKEETDIFLQSDYLFDLRRYHARTIHRHLSQTAPQPRRVIDVVRSAYVNLCFEEGSPPVVRDRSLRAPFELLFHTASLRALTGEDLNECLEAFNQALKDSFARGEVGFDSGALDAINWLDRKGHAILQGLTLEEQVGLLKREWFLSLLTFNLLTQSVNPATPLTVDAFVERVRTSSDCWTGFKLIAESVVSRMAEVADECRRDSLTIPPFDSGNLNYALLNLQGPKRAETGYGERYAAERTKSFFTPGYHPGD